MFVRRGFTAPALTVALALATLLWGACRTTPSSDGAHTGVRRGQTSASAARAPSRRDEPQSGDAFDALEARVVGEGDGPVVVLLHGYGAAADDLVALAPTLRVRPGMRFVFPAGPVRLGGAVGEDPRGWWSLPPRHVREAALASGGRDLSSEEPEGLVAARAKMVAFLRACSERFGVAPTEIVIGGFSQGAMLAVDAALHADEPPGVVFSLSGALVSEREWAPRMPRLISTRVFVSHGHEDTLLPFAGSERLVAALREAGVTVTFAEFHGDHELPHEVLMRLRAELEAILPAVGDVAVPPG